MKRTVLNCGYVPLVDSAPLIIAKALGFAEHEGISLNLLRQPSWAALRDLLAMGHLDAAHMLSPMPIAMSMGLSGPKVAVIAPFVLSANGTVFGVSNRLAADLRGMGWHPDHHAPAQFLAHLIATKGPIRVGVPFPYSMHRLLFEYLVRAAPESFKARLSIITTPPPLMADAVEAGEIDLFVVGEPWGSIAVGAGAAELVLPGSSIWAHAPEKVLGVRQDWAQERTDHCAALLRAVYRACDWLGMAENRSLASEILARSEHLDLPDHTIDASLTGQISPATGATPWNVEGFIRFGGTEVSFPWRSSGAWMGAQIAALLGLKQAQTIKAAAACMRPDLYRSHLHGTPADMPGASAKIEGSLLHPTAIASVGGQMILGADAFFDGETFDFGDQM